MRHAVLGLFCKAVVDDAFQPQQVIRRGKYLEEATALPEHPVELAGNGHGKERGEQGNGAVLHGKMGGGGAEPGVFLVFSGGAADGLLGDVHPGEGTPQAGCQVRAVVALAAADVQNFSPDSGIQGRLGHGPGDGLVEASLQEPPPGGHLLPGVPGGGGVLALDGQKMHIALAGNVKAVPVGTAEGLFGIFQRLPAQGTDQLHGHPSQQN